MTQAQHVPQTVFPQHSQPQSLRSQTTDVFGSLFFEVVLNGVAEPTLPDWSLRLWPQARLGDATLEASPLEQAGTPHLSVSELAAALKAQGVSILGPVRHHR